MTGSPGTCSFANCSNLLIFSLLRACLCRSGAISARKISRPCDKRGLYPCCYDSQEAARNRVNRLFSGTWAGEPLVRLRMAELLADTHALLEGLSEAAVIAAGARVLASNAAAKALLGAGIDGEPLNRVISHPAALEALERADHEYEGLEDVELTGLGGSRRNWLMRTAPLAVGTSLILFVDHSEARASEQMRVDFVANASHELRTLLFNDTATTE